MQSAPTKNRGWLVALGVLTLSLVSGLACPGNLNPGLDPGGGGPAGSGGGGSAAPCPTAPKRPSCSRPSAGSRPATSLTSQSTSLAGSICSPDPASRLVGVASTAADGSGSACPAGSIYINPGTAAGAMPTGLFVDKLTYATCGDRDALLVGWNDAEHPMHARLGLPQIRSAVATTLEGEPNE